jgi:hypothetical protein
MGPFFYLKKESSGNAILDHPNTFNECQKRFSIGGVKNCFVDTARMSAIDFARSRGHDNLASLLERYGLKELSQLPDINVCASTSIALYLRIVFLFCPTNTLLGNRIIFYPRHKTFLMLHNCVFMCLWHRINHQSSNIL